MRAFIGMDIPEDIKERILKASEMLSGNGMTLVKRELFFLRMCRI